MTNTYIYCVKAFSYTQNEIVFYGGLDECREYIRKNQVRLGSMCNLLSIRDSKMKKVE